MQVKKNNLSNVVEHFRGNEAFVRRIYDLMDQVERRQRIIVTPFFTPLETQICEQLLPKTFPYVKDGGYDGAQRCRFALLPYPCDADTSIVALKATYHTQYAKIDHRDVLGAVMNLGIERETIGDIIVNDGYIYLYVDKELESFIVSMLTRIKRCHVQFSVCEEEISHCVEISTKQVIVASLRLDVVIASMIHVSRSKAQALIQSKLVKVQHVVLEDTSHLCNNNSVISIRGYGQFQFFEVLKMTKKNHFVILIGTYQ